LSNHLRLGLPSGLFSSGFPTYINHSVQILILYLTGYTLRLRYED
jgi:hypothetical protein